MTTCWVDRFPGLRPLDPNIRAMLNERSRVVCIPGSTTVFAPGKKPDSMILVLEGTVRVQQVSEGGREIVLYRVSDCETCIMTVACLMAGETYSASGVTETEVKAVAIPRDTFEELMDRSSDFRTFVFASYSTRLVELFGIINEVAFTRVDVRLARKLIELADSGEIEATHQQLATELGSAREVISRQLHEFQRRGWIEAQRGRILLKNGLLLELLAARD